MSVAIKLMRIGKKGYANYRIIAVDKRKKRNGAYLDNIGFYNPMTDPVIFKIDRQKMDHWLQKGAQLSEGVMKLKKLIKATNLKSA